MVTDARVSEMVVVTIRRCDGGQILSGSLAIPERIRGRRMASQTGCAGRVLAVPCVFASISPATTASTRTSRPGSDPDMDLRDRIQRIVTNTHDRLGVVCC